MRIAFHGSEVEQGGSLSPPDLPQVKGGVLDLSWPSVVNEAAVKVEIPRYGQPGWGDRVTVFFRRQSETIVRRYGYLPNPGQFKNQNCVAEVRVNPLEVLPSGNYEVGYTVTSRTGNLSSSAVRPVQIINSSYTGNSRCVTVDAAFSATYMPGVIVNRVVPEDYSISPGKDIAIRSLAALASTGTVSTGVKLTVCQSPPDGGSQPIAYLQSTDGKQWTVKPASESEVVYLHRNDLISIILEGKQNARLFVALTM